VGGEVPLPALRELVHAAIDVVVHVARRPDGARAVAEVVELAAPGDAAAEGVRRLADGRRVVRGPTRAARATDVDRFEVTA
jgi:hypothetical protein